MTMMVDSLLSNPSVKLFSCIAVEISNTVVSVTRLGGGTTDRHTVAAPSLIVFQTIFSYDLCHRTHDDRTGAQAAPVGDSLLGTPGED